MRTQTLAIFGVAALGLVMLAAAAMLQAAAAPFDYYVLSLSWAPAFCAQPGEASANPQECATGKGVGFIVHGLWPESIAGKSPENCGSSTVPKSVVALILPEMFSASLIQHEWNTHGSCTGLKAFDFFSDVQQARAKVQVPVQIMAIQSQTMETPAAIEAQFAAANPGFPAAAFRTACSSGEFRETRACLDKNLKVRACTATVGECGSAPIAVLPPR